MQKPFEGKHHACSSAHAVAYSYIAVINSSRNSPPSFVAIAAPLSACCLVDATYALKVGELSGIVDTDSGVHIILRTA